MMTNVTIVVLNNYSRNLNGKPIVFSLCSIVYQFI